MASVDDRIVSLQFNNANFERRIADTVKSLGELKKSLDFANSGRGLADITATANAFNLNGIANAVNSISDKFSALGAVAFSVINSITAKALTVGAQIASSFTIAPVTSGFKEYETNINSIQTILANTKSAGTDLQDVSAALDELNEYSDQTIFNFAEMAKNIGTFTAAGVDLDTSVNAIKGIANLSALSGSNSGQAASAMYQLSQAIAAGRVTLIDWNSVVNAGIGGEVFKTQLFETAKALGTIEGISLDTTFEQWEAAGNLFRSSLQGSGIAIDATATAVEAATQKGLKSLADARERGAEANESSSRRVIDAEVNLAETAVETSEAIADAQKQRGESAVINSKAIIDAEKAQVDVFEQTAEAIDRAIKEQIDSVEEGAENVQDALDGVVNAQKRLQDALKPASTDELGAATDRLTTAQLDQADLSRSITDAQRDQSRAADDLNKAQQRLIKLKQAPEPDFEALNSAYRAVEDAQQRVIDGTDSQERAQIRQNEGTRAVTRAEEELAKVKIKGTEADEKVIEARSALEQATDKLVEIQEQAADRQQRAIKGLAEAQESSDERRTAAIDNVVKAKQKATDDEIKFNEAVADSVENSAKRQADAARTLADAQKANSRTQQDTLDLIERTRADAERAVDEAAAASGEAPSWLTSEVLTTALSAFTGDLDEAQFLALGYTEAQAKEMIELGKLAQDSATTVKTLTQLLGTVRESITSGWSQSFRIIFGDFEQAKESFTGLNDIIGEFIGTSSDARNAVLTGWADLGGRTLLIEAFGNAFEALASFIRPIRDAFKNIFPPQTAESLFRLTEQFANFTSKLAIGTETGDKIRRIFEGIFAVFEIGFEVVKNIAGVFTNIFDVLAQGVGGGFLDFFAGIGDAFANLNDVLIAGGGLDGFFDSFNDSIGNFLGSIGSFLTEVGGFGDGIKGIFTAFSDGLSGVISVDAEGLLKFVNDLGLAFNNLWESLFGDSDTGAVGEGVDRLSERLSVLDQIGRALGGVWDWLTDRFSIFGGVVESLAGLVEEVFNQVTDGIAQAFSPEKFDETLDLINTGLFAGLIALVGKFVTSGLKIDFGANLAENLSKGLQQLSGTLASMQAALRADALLNIAIAIAVLAAGLFVLASIDSSDLAKALAAMAVGFGQLVGTLAALAAVSSGKTGISVTVLAGGLILLAAAVVVLAGAIKILATIDPEDLAKGLAATVGIFGAMALASKLLSNTGPGLIIAGIGMIGLAAAIVILAAALLLLKDLSVGEITAGLTTIAIALGIIAAAVYLIPPTLPIVGAGLILVSIGLALLSVAILAFAAIDLGSLGQGLLGIGSAIVVIALAMSLMPLTLPLTAAGLILISIALTAIVASIALLGGLSLESLAKGIGGIAAVLIVLAAAAYAMSGSLLGAVAIGVMAVSLLALVAVLKGLATLSIKQLAIGLGAIAASLVVFGVAAALLTPLIPSLLGLGAALFLIGGAFALFGVGAAAVAQAFAVFAAVGAAGINVLIESIGALIKALPSFVQGFVDGMVALVQSVIDAAPALSEAFFKLLTVVLQDFVKILPELGNAIRGLITEMVKVIRESGPELIAAGFFILIEFLKGLRDNIEEITTLVGEIITKFLEQLREDNIVKDIVEGGFKLLEDFLRGISENLKLVFAAGEAIVQEILKGFGRHILETAKTVLNFVLEIIRWLNLNIPLLIQSGVNLAITILNAFGGAVVEIADAAFVFLTNLLNGLADVTRRRSGELRSAGANLALAVADGFTGGLASKGIGIFQSGVNVFGKVINGANSVLQRNSPSKVFRYIGEDVGESFITGLMSQNSAISKTGETIGQTATTSFKNALKKLPTLDDIGDINPKITPVLDLSLLLKDSGNIKKIFDSAPVLKTAVSFGQASEAAIADRQRRDSILADSELAKVPSKIGPDNINFEQNIFAPVALSPNEIYRQTRSQFVLAKEELSIP